MAFSLPNLGSFQQLVDDFKSSLNNIFGSGANSGNAKLDKYSDKSKYFKGMYGSDELDRKLWTGNTNRKGTDRLRYGFRIVSAKQISGQSLTADGVDEVYYLDIPPQAISQKEVFATDIQATRRGVVVQSEGVVFKDIVIQGTTGVFPGARNDYGGKQANFDDFTKAPKTGQGVSEDGIGKDKVVTGYAEFIMLRQFFLYYANEKVKRNGDRFLVFINEKDQQALVVEPLEFLMERSSKSPMTYQYKIALKAISTFENLVQRAVSDSTPDDLLTKIANVARNAGAAINQFRAAVALTNRLVQGISQEINSSFIAPLRLLGTALNDLAEARSNILAVPTVLSRNLNDAVLNIAENRFTNSESELAKYAPVGTGNNATNTEARANSTASGKISERGSTDNPSSDKLLVASKAASYVRSTIADLNNSAMTPVSRSFVQDLRTQSQDLADKIADALNIGNESYDAIKNRTQVNEANPLRTYTNNEFLLLGALYQVIDALNQILATNELFESDTESDFANKMEIFGGKLELNVPSTVRETTISQGESLERIALRVYGDASRWVDLAMLNNLKYPYIADTRADGVKKYGDKLLIGN